MEMLINSRYCFKNMLIHMAKIQSPENSLLPNQLLKEWNLENSIFTQESGMGFKVEVKKRVKTREK